MNDTSPVYSKGPPGLSLVQEAISPQAEASLLAMFQDFDFSYYAYDAGNPRSSVSFGWKYDYAADSFAPCAPIPKAFDEVCRIAADLADTEPEDFAECLVNRYEPGAIIQPHTDKPVWDRIVGVSLGSVADMHFSNPDPDVAPVAVRLDPRSIYVMKDDARYVWRHSLPAMRQTRWSMTLRTLSPEGRALQARYALADSG